MDPLTAYLISAAIGAGAGALGGIGSGGQDLSSFSRIPGVKPEDMLLEAQTRTEELDRLMRGFVSEPISLPYSFAQQPPVFTGGGLPMPIGLYAQDPAMGGGSPLFPDVVTRPGLSFPGPGTGPTRPGPQTPGPDPDQDDRRRKISPISGGDDTQEALEALELLIGGGRG